MAHTHPLLETVFPPRRVTLGDQVAALTRDVGHLARDLQRDAAPHLEQAARTAGDLAGGVVDHLEPMARHVAGQARAAGRMVRRDPVPTIVALGTLALIASLLLRRQ